LRLKQRLKFTYSEHGKVRFPGRDQHRTMGFWVVQKVDFKTILILLNFGVRNGFSKCSSNMFPITTIENNIGNSYLIMVSTHMDPIWVSFQHREQSKKPSQHICVKINLMLSLEMSIYIYLSLMLGPMTLVPYNLNIGL
jgi:hypothetical protein